MSKLGGLLLNLGKTLLGWILFDAAAFMAFLVMFINEDIVWPAYLGGAAVSIAAFCVLWRFVLRKTWRGLLDVNGASGIFWWILAAIALVASFAAFVFAVFCATGIPGAISPEWAQYYFYPYCAVILIFMIVKCIQIAKTRKKEA